MAYWCYGDPTYRVINGVPIDPSLALMNSVNKGLAYQKGIVGLTQGLNRTNLPCAVPTILAGSCQGVPREGEGKSRCCDFRRRYNMRVDWIVALKISSR